MIGPKLESAIERSAAPAAVQVGVERVLDAHPEWGRRLEDEDWLRDALVAVIAASRSLTEVCVSEPAALEVLSDLDHRRSGPLGTAEEVHLHKRLELLRIAARDLIGMDDLPGVGRGLAELAAEVFDAAVGLAGGSGLTVIGMGKLGGAELNYASDVDVLFVAEDAGAGDKAARSVLDLVRRVYRVDVDLRPEGRSGPLVRSLEAYEAYWDRWAQTWEFQALIKARPIAGDRVLGEAFLTRAQERLWARPFTTDDLRAVRQMKARAEGELARKGLTDREVKRGRGGIRDIEFAVQLLQLVHGRHDPALRSPTTLDVLAELARAAYVDTDDARALDHAYRLLRAVEHRLQLVQEQQVHALPTDAAGWDRLARVMGYRASPDTGAGELLATELRHEQATVRSIHEHLFFRPLLDALTAEGAPATQGPGLPEEAVVARLEAFGFTDAKRTRQALRELTHGLTRSSRLMQQMLPLVLGWLSESPDPDLGLLGLRLLASEQHRATELAVAFRESPEVARRLCLVAGTSRRLTETLEHHPDLIPALGDPEGLRLRSRDDLLEGATAALSWRGAVEERQRGLQRFQRREELRLAAADILDLDHDGASDTSDAARGTDPVVMTAAGLTHLAEASVQAALAAIEPALPLAVVALGRFGGAELSYASDLDVIFVYDGTTPADFAMAEKTAEGLLQFLLGQTPSARVYTVDAGLRPEGKDGPLARSLGGYRTYYDRWAQTWERQALIRARPVAGDLDVAARFMEIVEPHVWRDELPEADVREIRRMKARIERERLPAGSDPQFHLKLGRGSLSDVEFCVQLLQLQHRCPSPGTMAALERLQDYGVLARSDATALAEAYRFCERTRNRWFLVKGAPDDSLPTQAEQLARLARSLGTTPQDLRESYRRVTRRSRQVFERLFYGKDD